MHDEFTCRAIVTFQGRELHLNKIVSRIDLAEIAPPRGPILDPADIHHATEASERRRRFIDFLAAEFAHSLTEALFDQSRYQ